MGFTDATLEVDDRNDRSTVREVSRHGGIVAATTTVVEYLINPSFAANRS